MKKIERRKKILQILKTNRIDTQEELVEILKQEGYNVTQATISRDIREMNLTKVSDKHNKTYYSPKIVVAKELDKKFVMIFKNGIVDIKQAQNIVVLKTISGAAMAVASAVDAFKLDGIVGCIAGDDTIFLAAKDNYNANEIINKLDEYRME